MSGLLRRQWRTAYRHSQFHRRRAKYGEYANDGYDQCHLVAYTPKGSCRTVTKQWVEQFKVAFIGAAGAFPTISLTPLVTQVTPENVKCCNRAYGVSLATPLTISATFPAAPGA